MGPSGRGRGRPREGSLEPDSGDDDNILEAKEVEVKAVKEDEAEQREDPEEDVDDPSEPNSTFHSTSNSTLNGTSNSTSNSISNHRDAAQEEPTPVDPSKVKHTCVMSEINELTSPTLLCTRLKPNVMRVKDILPHYFHHYQERGTWNTLVPPTTAEDKAKISSFQCNLCNQKFRGSKDNTDPETGRRSFLYHYAVHHGKVLDAMQEDKEVDGDKTEAVFSVLHKYHPDARQFIDKGTQKWPTAPYTINENSDWKLKQIVAQKQVLNASPATQRITTYSSSSEILPCPFNNRPDCNELENNKHDGALKLHLFYHYLSYWEDIVPEFTNNEKETRCKDCSKRVNAQNAKALRTSMICHRAIQHNELKAAIEESIVEFDKDLFDRLFNPEKVPKLKVLYPSNRSVGVSQVNRPKMTLSPQKSTQPATDNGIPVKSFYKTAPSSDLTPVQDKSANQVIPVSASSLISKEYSRGRGRGRGRGVGRGRGRGRGGARSNIKDKKRRRNRDEDEDMTSSSDEEALPLASQPYVRKRIKQNLSNIDFEDDSDADSDWERKEKKKNKKSGESEDFKMVVTSPILPKKDRPARARNGKKSVNYEISDESDPDQISD